MLQGFGLSPRTNGGLSVNKHTDNLLTFAISVTVTIKDGPPAPEIKILPKHKKNPEVGEKKTVYTSTILLEQEDAASFEDQEEVNWRYHTDG